MSLPGFLLCTLLYIGSRHSGRQTNPVEWDVALKAVQLSNLVLISSEMPKFYLMWNRFIA